MDQAQILYRMSKLEAYSTFSSENTFLHYWVTFTQLLYSPSQKFRGSGGGGEKKGGRERKG